MLPLDTVVIDIGESSVDLVRWNGSQLRVEKLRITPSWEMLPQWLEWLGANPPCHVRLLSSSNDAIADTASGYDRPSRKAMVGAAARWLADRLRLGRVICIEVNAHFASAAMVEAEGSPQNTILASGPIESETAAPLEMILDWIRKYRDDSSAELIVGGELGPALAAGYSDRIGSALAESAGASRLWIPDFAGCMAAIGAILSPPPIQIELDAARVPLDSLSDSAMRAMEALSDELARSGYDFDDVVCETLAGIGCKSDPTITWVTFGPSSSIKDWAGSIQGCAPSDIEIRSIRARARLDMRHWELSPAVMTTTTLPPSDDAIRRLKADGPIVEREALPFGSVMPGPVTIRGAHHFTVVPPGWVVTCPRAGGLELRRH